MTSDTIRQKYLYNVPLFNDGYPIVKLDEISDEIHIKIKLSHLYALECKDLIKLMKDMVKMDINMVILYNDFNLQSMNRILLDSLSYAIKTYAYWFKKSGFKTIIQ